MFGIFKRLIELEEAVLELKIENEINKIQNENKDLGIEIEVYIHTGWNHFIMKVFNNKKSFKSFSTINELKSYIQAIRDNKNLFNNLKNDGKDSEGGGNGSGSKGEA